MSECPKCNHKNPADVEFCSACGFELKSIDMLQATLVHKMADSGIDGTPEGEEILKGSGPRLVVIDGPITGSKFGLAESKITVGRHPDSQIFLDDVTVSRRHAEIYKEGTSYRVRDLGSLNGTYINKERNEDAALNLGDEVQVGKFKFLFLNKDF